MNEPANEHSVVEVPQSKPGRRLAFAALCFCLGLILGIAGLKVWLATKPPVPTKFWSGTQLDGPEVAFYPRSSPDGRLVAFHAMVDGISQIGVIWSFK